MSKIYLTSDSHFYHKNVLEYCGRPFLTLDSMHKELIKRWNKVVGPNDLVYHLGDFSFSQKAHNFVSQLNGRKILILGNHDFGFREYETNRWRKIEAKYKKLGWSEVRKSETFFVRGIGRVRLSHFPPKGMGDWGEERYTEHRLEHTGEYTLVGHIHDSWKKRGNTINVGCDVWNFTPVSLETLNDLFLNTKGDLDAPKKLRRRVFKYIHAILNRIRGKRPFKRR